MNCGNWIIGWRLGEDFFICWGGGGGGLNFLCVININIKFLKMLDVWV